MYDLVFSFLTIIIRTRSHFCCKVAVHSTSLDTGVCGTQICVLEN